MEKNDRKDLECQTDETSHGSVYTPFPGADEKYYDGTDWRVYNPDKYRDPKWSPDKE